ncbi:hypothetical protein KC326_g81 [Hortaea werneckii]|nr:hypothetical protein KC326_g81 [Hortaea werneckii]
MEDNPTLRLHRPYCIFPSSSRPEARSRTGFACRLHDTLSLLMLNLCSQELITHSHKFEVDSWELHVKGGKHL